MNIDEVKDALTVGGAGVGVFAALRRMFGRGRGERPYRRDALTRIEDKLDQIRTEMADYRRSSDQGFAQIHREIENHREEDNRRFGELFSRLDLLARVRVARNGKAD